jgi:phosphatidylglycerophosphate synthase
MDDGQADKHSHPRTCTIFYSISCLLDAADGWAARAYDQTSTFGSVLDMVTDRSCTVDPPALFWDQF